MDRRRACEDPDLEELETIGDEEPVGLLRHVVNHRRVPESVLADDVIDGLWVLGYVRCHVPALPTVLDGLEFELIEMGYGLRVTGIAMAKPLNLRSAQAVDERYKRERAARQGLPRRASAEREARLRPRPRRRSQEEAWYDRNALSLWQAAGELAHYRKTHPELIDDDLAEDLAHLHEDVQAVHWPLNAAIFSTLRSIGARVRLLLADLNGQEYAVLRKELGELLPRLSDLATAQLAVLDD